MNARPIFVTLALAATACLVGASSGTPERASPEAAVRTYAENYKDMLLAKCLAKAYESEQTAANDAHSTASVLVDWTYYDAERSTDEIDTLIQRYLGRDYQNPLVEYKGVRFDLLKCLDLYHSKDLAQQVRRFVPRPNRTYRQDNPPAKR
jgi:hypothetical protein